MMKIKHFIFSMVWVIAGIFISGCIVIDLNGCSAQSVKGSGKVISELRQVPEFRELRLEGRGKVALTQGNESSIEVTSDDNILPSIETAVVNGQLILSHENGKNLRPTTLNYTITVKDLKGVSIAGSGDIVGIDEFKSKRFYADIAGSGDITIKVSADHLESGISGSGSISLSGSTNSHDARITGSGDVDAFDLQTKNSSVVITGSGNCRIRVSDKLQAKITGSGDVLYKGHPQVSESIRGSGKVKDRN
jgi:hypothetical protein